MSIPVCSLHNINVYDLSAGKTLPQWLDDAYKRKLSLRYHADYRTRIELIQDFNFPIASSKVKLSPNGEYLIASGVYPPQIKIFDLSNLSLKCERHVDSAVIQFLFLSDDYSKVIYLREDRSIEFHAKFGYWDKIRLPKFCTDISYCKNTCDVIAVGASNEVYRFNLAQGSFFAPLETDFEKINVCGFNPVHSLIGFGGNNSTVQFFDYRDRNHAASLSVAKSLLTANSPFADSLEGSEITSLRFDNDGISFAVGSSTGHCLLYDLRSSRPIYCLDHKYSLPIRNIKFHNSSKILLTCDSKIIKLWRRDSGESYTSIQPANDINDICIIENTGLLFAPGEQHRINTYYVPSLGPSPKWISYLDSLTEELAESIESLVTVYDDYKFLTRQELESLQLTHLIGSNLLKAYMHGFFVDVRLYNRIKTVVEPFAYKNYIKDQVKKKIDASRKERISIKKRLPNVNKRLAENLLDREDTIEETGDNFIDNPLKDSRFAQLFSDSNFEIDEHSAAYKQLHPSGKRGFVGFDTVDVDDESDAGHEVRTFEASSNFTSLPLTTKAETTKQKIIHQCKDMPLEERIKAENLVKELPTRVTEKTRRKHGGMRLINQDLNRNPWSKSNIKSGKSNSKSGKRRR